MKKVRLALAALAAAFLLPAQAILTRADRDDEEYVELATRYPAAVSLGPGGGVGVLVGPRWILTAAHRANALRAGAKLALAGEEVTFIARGKNLGYGTAAPRMASSLRGMRASGAARNGNSAVLVCTGMRAASSRNSIPSSRVLFVTERTIRSP